MAAYESLLSPIPEVLWLTVQWLSIIFIFITHFAWRLVSFGRAFFFPFILLIALLLLLLNAFLKQTSRTEKAVAERLASAVRLHRELGTCVGIAYILSE